MLISLTAMMSICLGEVKCIFVSLCGVYFLSSFINNLIFRLKLQLCCSLKHILTPSSLVICFLPEFIFFIILTVDNTKINFLLYIELLYFVHILCKFLSLSHGSERPILHFLTRLLEPIL